MSKVGDTVAIKAERGHQMIVGCLRIHLRVRVSRRSAERHVTTVLGKEHGVARMSQYLVCPVQLPYSEIGISMKAEENTRRGSRISHDEPNEPLSVRRFVIRAPGFDQRLSESRGLKENSLLRPPD